ncbi:MAG: OmpA family protein, partial [Bacteroidales bacterium]|nr:OmpA family protein [Bacteroidales bacterium]
MTRKSVFILMLSLASAVQMKASPSERDSLLQTSDTEPEVVTAPLTPSYLKNVTTGGGCGSNWFLNVQGGASAFIGTPVGCADLFDRTLPVLQVNVGKWFTPAVGGRIGFQGLEFKDSNLRTRSYQFFHADFMYNLTHGVRVNEQGLSRWDIIPFVGVGLIHNDDYDASCACVDGHSDSHPFAFSYGLQGRYRLNNRLHLTAEISGMTTFQNFDCVGSSNRFGDNMLNLSAGLSITIGKTGWKRVVDAKPYMAQNEWLMEHNQRLEEKNRYLSKLHTEDERIIAEYNKVLEIEGLLDFYGDRFKGKGKEKLKCLYPKNDYSGLNSLRARLNNRSWDGDPNHLPRAMKKRDEELDKDSEKELNNLLADNNNEAFEAYIQAMLSGNEIIGAPVYFFFNLNTSILTDVSQNLNIDAIAKVAKTHGLKVKVIGAADSATGTSERNQELSKQRAKYIEGLLLERGIDFANITTAYEGGI